MCILSRLKRLCCKQNKHHYIISSNSDNNDIIIDEEHSDLTRPYDNCKNYRYNKNYLPEKIVSWNINEVLCFSTPHSQEIILKRLKIINADIICLQGVYNNRCRKFLIDNLKEIYQYYITGDLYQNYKLGEHSGLLIISKFPIIFNKIISFNKKSSIDNLCNKGVLYVTINNINIALAHCSYYCDIYLIENELSLIKETSPFQEYIVVGCLQHPEAYKSLTMLKNNNCYTNIDKKSINDYILSSYTTLKITINISYLDISLVSYNFPIIATIYSNYYNV
jgi:hypothetical protein